MFQLLLCRSALKLSVVSQEAPVAADESMEAARLVRLEHRLTALWERVEASGQQAEQRHREVLQLYTDLQQQQSSARSGGDEAWLSGLMAQQLRTRLDEDRRQREQVRYGHTWTRRPGSAQRYGS